jgi:hypothetical protein
MSRNRDPAYLSCDRSLHIEEDIMAFAAFMATALGRLIRIVAGTALVLVGLAAIGGLAGWIVAAVGLGLVALGTFNFCVLAPLAGGPFSGREALEREKRATT